MQVSESFVVVLSLLKVTVLKVRGNGHNNRTENKQLNSNCNALNYPSLVFQIFQMKKIIVRQNLKYELASMKGYLEREE